MNRRLEKYRDLCVELLEERKRPSDFRRQFIATYWADRTKWTPPEKRLLQDLTFILKELDDEFSIRQASEMSLRSMLLMEEPVWFDKAVAKYKLVSAIPGVLIFTVALGTYFAFQAWMAPISEKLSDRSSDQASEGVQERSQAPSASDAECRVDLVGGIAQTAGRGGDTKICTPAPKKAASDSNRSDKN